MSFSPYAVEKDHDNLIALHFTTQGYLYYKEKAPPEDTLPFLRILPGSLPSQ